MVTVYLKGIQAHGRHGVAPEEKVLGHRFRCDVEIDLHASPDRTDNLTDTVNYAAVALFARSVLARGGSDLFERLAGEIADGILAMDERIARVRVDVAKLQPPIDVLLDEAGARVERSRG